MSDKPVIFISYSHEDEPNDGPEEDKWLSYVQHHLAPAVKNGIFELWDDEKMPIGDAWRATIKDKLGRCDICVLLVSPSSLASDYVIDVEIETIKERRKTEDVPLYPIRIMPFAEKTAPWVMEFNLRPKNGFALWELPSKERKKEMIAIANEIVDEVEKIAKKKKELLHRSRQLPRQKVGGIRSFSPDAALVDKRPLPDLVAISGLPETGYEQLRGRDTELGKLDAAWNDPNTNIISLVAEGGAGKSALTNEWLRRLKDDNYGEANIVLGWSFYSQGTKERATSAEGFLSWAIDKLRTKIETTSATAKGEAIAEELLNRRVLLVLDGVEPLQHGPGPQVGQLKDLGLRALLRRFAAATSEQKSLIALTSRLAVADISRWKDSTAPVLPVEELSEEAGGALLRDNGIWGTDRELMAASRDFGGHPLGLGLLASYLKEKHFGDVRRRDHIRAFVPDPENPRHDHARRVMESYEKEWLADQPVLHAIMHVLGLFDRPASKDCLEALRKRPIIAGLTEKLVELSEKEWTERVRRLRDVRLLSDVDPAAPDALDAHPLVREWFGERLKEKNGRAWREAHRRLYEYLRDTTEEGDEPTLEDLAPLYQAIPHGCRAGLQEAALDEIYINRICRPAKYRGRHYYAMYELGAFGSDLAAVSWFFDSPFDAVVNTLGYEKQSWLMGVVAFLLRNQGRVAEALPIQRIALSRAERSRTWVQAAVRAGNLSEMELLTGMVALAIESAAKSIEYADRSDEKEWLW